MQLSKPRVSTEDRCSFVDLPPSTRRPGGGGGSSESPARLEMNCVSVKGLPQVQRYEKVL